MAKFGKGALIVLCAALVFLGGLLVGSRGGETDIQAVDDLRAALAAAQSESAALETTLGEIAGIGDEIAAELKGGANDIDALIAGLDRLADALDELGLTHTSVGK